MELKIIGEKGFITEGRRTHCYEDHTKEYATYNCGKCLDLIVYYVEIGEKISAERLYSNHRCKVQYIWKPVKLAEMA